MTKITSRFPRSLLPRLAAPVLAASLVLACGHNELEVVRAAHWKKYVFQAKKPWGDPLNSLHFRKAICEKENLKPTYETLDETHLISFLEARNLKVSVERPRSDLAFVIVSDAQTKTPARLRVAILDSADKAGTELAAAIKEHGKGSWGVHRGNLAVLGPIGSTRHDLAFAAETHLICWGVFTVASEDGPLVISGGYKEL